MRTVNELGKIPTYRSFSLANVRNVYFWVKSTGRRGSVKLACGDRTVIIGLESTVRTALHFPRILRYYQYRSVSICEHAMLMKQPLALQALSAPVVNGSRLWVRLDRPADGGILTRYAGCSQRL